MSDTQPTVAQLAERITRLEELVSHQQHLLEQLNEIAMQQQQQLVTQKREYKAELDRLQFQMANRRSEDLPHEKPPHY